MSKSSTATGFGIGTLAARTGLTAATIRAWEERFGFPDPGRLPSGHRRYTDDDVDAVDRVLALRRAGTSLAGAIRAATRPAADTRPATLFAGLRQARPDLPVSVLSRRAMLALSHAIEDECTARAVRPLLAAAFQVEAAWDNAQPRWTHLSRVAEEVVVFADFERTRRPHPGLLLVGLEEPSPLAREWSVLCAGDGLGAVLAGWERADGRFEAIWSTDEDCVELSRLLVGDLVEQHAPDQVLAPGWRDPSRSLRSGGAAATAIATRALVLLDR